MEHKGSLSVFVLCHSSGLRKANTNSSSGSIHNAEGGREVEHAAPPSLAHTVGVQDLSQRHIDHLWIQPRFNRIDATMIIYIRKQPQTCYHIFTVRISAMSIWQQELQPVGTIKDPAAGCSFRWPV